MRFVNVLTVPLLLMSTQTYGQQLSAREKKVLSSARARYYNLEASGFESLNCSVKFDFSTAPMLQPGSENSTRKLLEATEFSLTLDDKGRPEVHHRFPDSSTASEQQGLAAETNLLTSLISGVFQTWPTKGLQGPIPPFDSEIESVLSKDDGYTINLKVPGSPVHLELDKDYVATEIDSIGGKTRERPTYQVSPNGLVFVGNNAVSDGEQGKVEVQYTLETAVMEGLRLPSSVRLKVNQNIDVKFALTGCTVKKSRVLNVDPPADRKKP